MDSIINVGVAKIEVATKPAVLRTILGSCVGICIYDRMKKVGGLAHILLPNWVKDGVKEKYADTAIPLLINQLLKMGCTREFMSAKIAGGASMFRFGGNLTLGQIGERNIEVARKVLAEKNIPIVAEDVGGNCGRVLDFFLEDGRMKIKAAGHEKIYYKV
ncbi:MAG: chemotaxis protein CheD [Spirochaetes bacterium]|nr:chemotaxis protein CheD [Spirochaetota bacterium]